MQLLLAKNQVNIISLAAILGGQVQAEAMASIIWLLEQDYVRCSLYFQISGRSKFYTDSQGGFIAVKW